MRRRTEELERADAEQLRLNAELRLADRRKDEFLATLAHELRNPLAPIRNAAEIIKAKGPLDPDLAWGRDVIERQVGQMARLLDDLLDISRITRNTLALRRGRVTLASVIDSAIETSAPLAKAGGHDLRVDLPTEPIHLDADPVRLAQVFANLLNNAAKYTQKPGEIRLTATREGDRVAVSVQDSGIGIDAGELPHIFEMFAQAKTALERTGGLGIGLALSKGLVEMHGGTIEAHSEGKDKGSTFVVRLPFVAAGIESTANSANDLDKGRAAARRVLVVDDLADNADTLSTLLGVLGHDVRTAYDGKEAIAIAAEFEPDVVLLDIGMPVLNGYAVCRRIRERTCGAQPIIVAMTGWGQDIDRRRSEEAGFDHHVVKPVDPAVLRRILDGVPGPQLAG